jgi:hypothetical protein
LIRCFIRRRAGRAVVVRKEETDAHAKAQRTEREDKMFLLKEKRPLSFFASLREPSLRTACPRRLHGQAKGNGPP